VAVGVISEMGYVSLRTRDLTASVKTAAETLGLNSMRNTGAKAYLSAAAIQHELVYTKGDTDGVDHFGLVAPNEAELQAIREKVARGGWRIVSENPIEDHIERGFAFVGPEGFTWHVYLGMQRADQRLGGYGPDRFGHINVQVQDTVAMKDFLIDVFDFRVSDRIGVDAGFFLRCNTDHHGIAVVKGDGRLHHHAWQTHSILDLARLGDRLARAGSRLLWGPVRHGAGHNIAAYFVEPTGAIIELYTDLEQIFDKERPELVWDENDSYWINQWDGLRPPNIREFGVHPVLAAAGIPGGTGA